MTAHSREEEKKREILQYLHENVFDAIIDSENASNRLKQGVRLTITRMEQLSSTKIVQYYWSAVIGTERSTEFAKNMREEGFTRFEEILEPFRNRFNDKWMRS